MAAGPTSLAVVVLAAGQGTRMRSDTIKLLHPVAGRPMVDWVLDAVAQLRPERTIAIVGFQADRMRSALAERDCEFVLQREQRGTGHAVLTGARSIRAAQAATVLVLNGDLPTLRTRTLKKFLGGHRRSGAALSVLTAELPDPAGYGRVLRDDRGAIRRIVEHRDASAAERRVPEINCGIYCASPGVLLPALKRLRPDNAQGEYYLTDAVHALIDRGKKVVAVLHDDAEEVLGVNTRRELAQASATLYGRKADQLLADGVTLMAPERTWIDPRAKIGRDTVIYPDVIVEGACRIGKGTVIRSGVRIANCRIGTDVRIKDHSVLSDSQLGDRVQIGPFAHLRPASELGPDARVGNFVELKKTRLGAGSKASHLAYLGDADIGAGCNIGAGTITCNYDGVAKHRTVLERDVFIGSDAQLVAPVRVRRGAYVAAGTTVTVDVPAGALAIGRGRQRNIDGWVARRRRG